jgi:dTDP-4-amino-4,6-dideoxygalactose transaminase
LVLLDENDKVLTTPNSFLATSNSILYANAKPIFVDIYEDGNINLDLCEVELKKDSTIKAIYVVHFSGNPINQDKLKYLKETYNIKILEDCAHSIGAKIDGIKAGSCTSSDISIFSFHPVKHITTGEGGAITTNDEEIYKKLLLLRGHGMSASPDIAPWHYDMVELGFNYRLTDISCALGLSQLKKLDSFLYLRRSIAKRYDDFFAKIDFIKPLYPFTNNSAYHLYVIKIDFEKLNINKKEFVLKMREKNIGLQLHYIPINKQPYYNNLGFGEEDTPIMDDYYKKAISLPIYPNFSVEEQEYVCEKIVEILK